MTSMGRRLAGIAAIVAVALSATGAAFMPPCDVASEEDMSEMAMPGMPGMPSSGQAPEGPSDSSDCPLALLGNGTSCLAAALTAATTGTKIITAQPAHGIQLPGERMPSDLLSVALFHPPKL